MSMTPDHSYRAMRISDFCDRYGIGRTKTYGEIKSGRLRAFKSGRSTLIKCDDADAWLVSLRPVAPATGAKNA